MGERASHYQTGDHECFDVVAEWHTSWPKRCVFPLGSTLKYLARLGRKTQDFDSMRSDLVKAAEYLAEAIRRLDEERNGNP